MYSEQELILQLKEGDKEAFTWLFRKYYRDLVLFAGNYILDKDTCEDIVQNVFVNLWAKRGETDVKVSPKSFLLKSVQNACLDALRHKKTVYQHEAFIASWAQNFDLSTEHYILYSDLEKHVADALEKLPLQYRETFELSRIQGIKYKDIAKKFDVSERTIEERIGKTIKLLRYYLKDFLHFLLFLYVASITLGVFII